MRNLFILLRKDFYDFLGINLLLHTPEKKKRAALFISLYVLGTILALGVVTLYCYGIGVGLNAVGLIALYPVVIAAAVSLTSFITTISKAPDILFSMRDFDMVLSLPIPSYTVATANVLKLYNLNLAFSLLLSLPAGGVYAVLVRPGVWFYPAYLLLTMCMPVIPSILAAIIGAITVVIGASFRKSRYASLVFLFLFTLVFAFLPTVLSTAISADPTKLVDLSSMLAAQIQRYYPLSALYSQAVLGNFSALMSFFGISLAGFVVTNAFFGKYYVRVNTFLRARRARKHYKIARQESATPRRALLRREFLRYFACNSYVLNTSFGLLLSLIASVAAVFMGADKIGGFLNIVGAKSIVMAAVCFLLAFMMGISPTTGSSISLEGKALWVAKSLPISAMDYVHAKLYLNLLLFLPVAVVDSLLLTIALKPTPLFMALIFLTPVCYATTAALLGLVINLKVHNFDWTSEVKVVKRSFGASAPVFIMMFLTMPFMYLVAVIPAMDYALLPLLCTLFMAVSGLVLYAVLRKNAEKWVAKL